MPIGCVVVSPPAFVMALQFVSRQGAGHESRSRRTSAGIQLGDASCLLIGSVFRGGGS
jgi:hypothetical protein